MGVQKGRVEQTHPSVLRFGLTKAGNGGEKVGTSYLGVPWLGSMGAGGGGKALAKHAMVWLDGSRGQEKALPGRAMAWLDGGEKQGEEGE